MRDRDILIAVVEAARREGQELSSRYQGDSLQLVELLIAKLTAVLTLLRKKESVFIETVQTRLDEGVVFLETWTSALDSYPAADPEDEKWKAEMLADWRKLRAKIEPARALLAARARPSQQDSDFATPTETK